MVIRILLALTVLVTFYGCGLASSPQDEGSNQKPKKVVVNEGLSKEEEQELSKRLEELEKKVEDDSQKTTNQLEERTQEPSPNEGRTEAALLMGVEDYYRAVHGEDWAYTYSHLDSQTQALFDEEEWRSKNQYYADLEQLGQPSAIDVQVNNPVSDPVVGVSVFRAFDSGTTIDRDTAFVWEDGEWKHRFIGEELELYMPEASYEEFVAVQEGASPSSASATATATASPSAAPETQEAGTKHVKVVVTSDVPVDVSIMDDNFDVSIAEEINGTKTYEFDIQSDSGLLVDAMNMDMDSMSGNVSIAVYENGKLKTEDSDSTGYAQVMY